MSGSPNHCCCFTSKCETFATGTLLQHDIKMYKMQEKCTAHIVVPVNRTKFSSFPKLFNSSFCSEILAATAMHCNVFLSVVRRAYC